MSYQALYRTFRPEGFSGVVGQEPIVTTLVNQILTNRIAHAYLFCGSHGTGKTSTAKIFARAINCLHPGESGDPCGQCEACLALRGENSMDVIEIDAASNNGVDEIRELRDKIKYPPSSVRYKVYIIDEVHMLSAGAFNALLKTLEEPPAHAVFILATTEPQKLPATILSRCQRYDFRRLPADVIIARLRMVLDSIGREAGEDALSEIARASEGGMRDALSLMDMCLSYDAGVLHEGLVRDVLGATDRRTLFAFADALIAGEAQQAIALIDQRVRAGGDPLVFSREVAGHARALMLAQLMGEPELAALLSLTREDAARLIAQAGGVPQEKLMRTMELFMQMEGQMRWAAQPRAALELCAVRACRPQGEQGHEALLERVAQLEDRLSRGVPVAAAPKAADPGPVPPPEADPDAPPFDVPPQTPPTVKPALAAPAPKSPPQKAPAAEVEGQAQWDQTVALIREHHIALYPPVSYIKFMGLDGDVAQLCIPRRWNMYLGVLDKDDKRRLLEQQLAQAFGRPLRARLYLEDTAQRPAAKAPQGTLQQVYDLFGRENVSVLDE